WWSGDIDGIEHGDESLSREHYVEWQRGRLLSLLGEADVHPGEYDVILAKIQAGREGRARGSRIQRSPAPRSSSSASARTKLCSSAIPGDQTSTARARSASRRCTS